MFVKLTPERAITMSRLCVLLTCCWPLSSNATKTQVLCFKIIRFGCIISAAMLLLPLCYAIYVHYDDTIISVKSACLAASVTLVISQTLVSASQYDEIQELVTEMEMVCKNAKKHEREILQDYVNNCSTFYAVCVTWFYVSASVVILGTLLLAQPFPTDAEYPFSTDYLPLKCIIFLHQSFVGYQCAAHVSLSSFSALLLWFSSARFKILMVELQLVTDVTALIKCVQKHQHIRRYAGNITGVTRLVALQAVLSSVCVVILCGITIIGKQSFTIKVQFFFLSITGLLIVFMNAWPADHLMDMSEDVTTGAYESPWYVQTQHIQKLLLCLLMPQKPVTNSVSCIMPTLSLNYYCSYLSNAFSAFTALRVTLTDEDEN